MEYEIDFDDVEILDRADSVKKLELNSRHLHNSSALQTKF